MGATTANTRLIVDDKIVKRIKRRVLWLSVIALNAHRVKTRQVKFKSSRVIKSKFINQVYMEWMSCKRHDHLNMYVCIVSRSICLAKKKQNVVVYFVCCLRVGYMVWMCVRARAP